MRFDHGITVAGTSTHMSCSLGSAGRYKLPLHVSCAASICGHVLYALAYKVHFLYLILIGRTVGGIAFSMQVHAGSLPVYPIAQ